MKVAICLIRRIYSGSFQNLSLPNTSGLRGSEMAGHEQQILHFITPHLTSTVSQENSRRHLGWNTLLRLLELYSLSSNFVFRFAFFFGTRVIIKGLWGFRDKLIHDCMIMAEDHVIRGRAAWPFGLYWEKTGSESYEAGKNGDRN